MLLQHTPRAVSNSVLSPTKLRAFTTMRSQAHSCYSLTVRVLILTVIHCAESNSVGIHPQCGVLLCALTHRQVLSPNGRVLYMHCQPSAEPNSVLLPTVQRKGPVILTKLLKLLYFM